MRYLCIGYLSGNGLKTFCIDIKIIERVKKHTAFFSTYTVFFRTKNLQSPGTYISKRTWDPSQKAITK